jgi:hypothetical protein
MSFHILQGATNSSQKTEELRMEIDYGMKILKYEAITLDVEDDITPLSAYSSDDKIVVFYKRDDSFVDMKVSLLKMNFRTKVFINISMGDIPVILGLVERTF